MKIRARLLVLLLVYALHGNAQALLHTVGGTVSDSGTGEKLELVAVSLTGSDSSHLLASAMTDSSGKFRISAIAAGSYFLQLSFLGYQKKKIAVSISAAEKDLTLPEIRLIPAGTLLKEAVVLSEKPVIRFEAGKIVYDVQKTVTDGAETMQESLQKIPGVTVNQDGSVEVKGKGGVTYLVDGKPSPLAQSNPELFLRSIQAKNIESIEVITNPSAKYDASGSSAIINIHLKKGKLEGLNGSVNGSIGTVFDKYSLSGNINYKKGNFNVWGNASFRDEQSSHWGTDHRQTSANDTTATYNTYSSGKNHNVNESGKIGLEYSFDKHQSVTYSLDMSGWQNSNYNNRSTSVSDPTTPGLSERLVQDQSSGHGLNESNSLNYRHTWDSSDRAWTIDITHSYQQNDGNSQSLSKAYDSAKNEQYNLDFFNHTHSYGENQNVLIKTDYNTPLKLKDTRIEAGFKEEIKLNDNHSDVYSDYADQTLPDTTQTTHIRYLESVTAAYVVYSSKLKDLWYSGGLRWEQTVVNSDLSAVSQNYADLFPSASLSYRINDQHHLNLSYSRRINRPSFWMLNNAISHSSPYAYSTGNPDLQPSFANSLELSYNAQAGKQNFYVSLNYSRETGAFTNITSTDPKLITHSTYENAGTNDNFYAGANASLKITKWWDASIWTGYGYRWYRYTENGSEIRNEGGALNISGNTNFKFWKNASLQLNGWGNSGWVSAQARGKAVCGLNISLKKKFFKEKLIVTLRCRDFLHTQIWRTTNFSPGLYDYNEYHYQSTVGYLTLTYQFGKQTFTPDTKDRAEATEGPAAH